VSSLVKENIMILKIINLYLVLQIGNVWNWNQHIFVNPMIFLKNVAKLRVNPSIKLHQKNALLLLKCTMNTNPSTLNIDSQEFVVDNRGEKYVKTKVTKHSIILEKLLNNLIQSIKSQNKNKSKSVQEAKSQKLTDTGLILNLIVMNIIN
jgi:hypothetical protein